MIGFFEHQYLSYKKNHIKNLIALAKADGHMHDDEVKLLYKVGEKYGLKDRQIKELLESKEKYQLNIPKGFDNRMNLLYDVIQMVYADGVVEPNEIAFCEDLVEKFGMKKQTVKWLIDLFEKGMPASDDWEDIKEEAREKYLLKK